LIGIALNELGHMAPHLRQRYALNAKLLAQFLHVFLVFVWRIGIDVAKGGRHNPPAQAPAA